MNWRQKIEERKLASGKAPSTLGEAPSPPLTPPPPWTPTRPEPMPIVQPTVTAGEAAKRAGMLADVKLAAASPTSSLRERLAVAEARPYAEEAAAEGEAAAPSMGEGLGRLQPPIPPPERLIPPPGQLPDAILRLDTHIARNDARAKSLQAMISAGMAAAGSPMAYGQGPPHPEVVRMQEELRRLDAATARLEALRGQWNAAAAR